MSFPTRPIRRPESDPNKRKSDAARLNGSPSGTEARVCDDIRRRQQIGIKKYGITVEANSLPLSDWLQHAYEECLDQAIYLRRALDEIEEKQASISKEQGEKIAEIKAEVEEHRKRTAGRED